MNGFIKLHRQITSWGWYKDGNTARVFLHLLLTANWEDSDFEGQKVKRGQAVFGLLSLANKLNLSVQNVRTALSHLKSTCEITVRPTRRFSIATIEKYGFYQDQPGSANMQCNTEIDSQITTNQQRANIEPTTSKNRRNKEEKEKGEAWTDGGAVRSKDRRPPVKDYLAGTEWDMSTWNRG